MPEHIAWLPHIRRTDESLVGAKAADLGEMSGLDLPVPNGFVVTTAMYYAFLQQTGLRLKMEALLDQVNTSDMAKLQQLSQSAQQLVRKAKMPKELETEITQAYHRLSSKDIFVAIRASVPGTEIDDVALSQPAMLNIVGSKNVASSVQEMWANLFTTKSLYARAERGMSQISNGLAVIVQRMVEAESSGILFTVDPMATTSKTVSIEAVWGLGEPIVSGALTPDHYEVDRDSWKITHRDIVRQEWQLISQSGSRKHKETTVKLPVSAAWQRKQKLSDAHIMALARLAVKVEEHFGQPQDCEWAYANQTLYLVQTSPVVQLHIPATSLIEQPQQSVELTNPHPTAPVALVQGQPASAGVVTGPVRLIRSIQDLSKLRNGEVLVCQTTDVAYDAALHKAAAVVTFNGGLSSHAAAMARQIGIPAVVEAGETAGLIQSGEIVTVDGNHGFVYPGIVHLPSDETIVSTANATATLAAPGDTASSAPSLPLSTATKVYVNLTEPEMAEEIAARPVDGVGLLRAEYMLSRLGEHPEHLIKTGKSEAVVSTLYEGLMTVAKAFNPRPVIYRSCDFTSKEFARLIGGDALEIEENNPLLGYRGARRYANSPDVFKLELAALRKARSYYKNLWYMVPFVRTPAELVAVKQLLAEEGLYRSSSFKLYMMVEVPSTVFLLDQFLAVGLDGVSIGSNDLTQLILGIDRDNPHVAGLFDERNEAVQVAMEQVVRNAAKHGVACSICGQAPSVYPEIARNLVSWGITSISVSPEAAGTTRRLVADAEYQLVRESRLK